MFKKCLGLFVLLITTGQLYSQEIKYEKFGIDASSGIPEGLPVGQTAPDFRGKDDAGQVVSLKSLLQHGPVVLFFYRGEWCPVCKRYLKQYRDSLDLVVAQGASVVAVTPETAANIEKTRQKTGFRFTVVSDPDRKIMTDYDVLFHVTDKYRNKIKLVFREDIAEVNGDPDAWLPVPATYIISRKGYITARYFNPDYRDRSPVRWMLDHLPD